jgi:hypothetical protein
LFEREDFIPNRLEKPVRKVANNGASPLGLKARYNSAQPVRVGCDIQEAI